MLYEEGGPGGGFNLYLEKGQLRAGAWYKPAWPGTWLAFDKIEPGRWYRAALVLRDAGAAVAPDKLELYVDGTKIGSGQAALVGNHGGDINLGRNGNTAYANASVDAVGDYFTGRLGEVEIYNRALSAEELGRKSR